MEQQYHYKNGLWFSRSEDGSVKIKQLKNNGKDGETEVLFEVTVDENCWASAVSSMSKKGESDGRFYKALEFHNE